MKEEYITGPDGVTFAFYPDEDLLLCDAKINTYAGLDAMRMRLYWTQNGRFYKITEVSNEKTCEIVSPDDAQKFLAKNSAYINCRNYDEVFGRPDRG